MASVAQAKTIGKSFSNEVVYDKVIYDFAVDGGATGALTLWTASAACVVTYFHAVVKTTATSGGSATVIVGATGDTDRFIKVGEGAVASLTANAIFKANPELSEGTPNTILMTVPHIMAAADVVLMTIGTAALTAGKIEFTIGYMRA